MQERTNKTSESCFLYFSFSFLYYIYLFCVCVGVLLPRLVLPRLEELVAPEGFWGPNSGCQASAASAFTCPAPVLCCFAFLKGEEIGTKGG